MTRESSSSAPVKRKIFYNPLLQWLAHQNEKQSMKVARIPFNDSREWHFTPDQSKLIHKTGKFFSIEGIAGSTNFAEETHCCQPIINQPEVGILGFLVQKREGILQFLVQAKIEPGNVSGVQIAPTLQATLSNYSRVHHGKNQPFLEYFLECDHSQVLYDQLQSEQGSRFLKKRNRNMIVQLPDHEVSHCGDT